MNVQINGLTEIFSYINVVFSEHLHPPYNEISCLLLAPFFLNQPSLLSFLCFPRFHIWGTYGDNFS